MNIRILRGQFHGLAGGIHGLDLASARAKDRGQMVVIISDAGGEVDGGLEGNFRILDATSLILRQSQEMPGFRMIRML